MAKKWIIEIISLFFVILFVYTGFSKLSDFQEFSAAIGKSPMLSQASWFIPYFIPSIEIIISILLVIPRFRLIGLYSSFSLMLMFTTYLFLMIYYSDYRPCTCGGIIQEMSWTTHLYFNIGATIMAFIGILMQFRIGEKLIGKPVSKFYGIDGSLS